MNVNRLPFVAWALSLCVAAAADEPKSSPSTPTDEGTAAVVESQRDNATKSPAEAPEGEANSRERAAPSAEEIGRWIAQLDSDEYWTREEASKRLFQAGRAAVAALGEAARSHKLETSTRAVGVLARLLDLDDAQIEESAEAVLEEIAGSRVTSAATRAQTALLGYRERRQDRVLAKFRQLGANVTATALGDGEYNAVDITIGEGWQGANDDLAALKRVPSLRRLSIYQAAVDDTALKHLAPLKQLKNLDLFGAGISSEGAERLKTAMAGTTVERRKGGLLGVTGDRFARGGGCLITFVQAGTAADKAGLQAGDVITKFEGKSVDDFDSLTALIATKGGGEMVELELERQIQAGEKIEKQTLTKKATLDQWKEKMTITPTFEGQIIIGR
jgi:S1-C subfamily serine protease